MLPAFLGSMYVVLSTFPPVNLQNVGPFYFTFDLAIVAVGCFINIHSVLKKISKEQPLARADTLFCFFNFDLFVFMLLASPNWKHV